MLNFPHCGIYLQSRGVVHAWTSGGRALPLLRFYVKSSFAIFQGSDMLNLKLGKWQFCALDLSKLISRKMWEVAYFSTLRSCLSSFTWNWSVLHSVKITEIFSHIFERNIVKATFLLSKEVDFTKYFSCETKFLIFPHCDTVTAHCGNYGKSLSRIFLAKIPWKQRFY